MLIALPMKPFTPRISTLFLRFGPTIGELVRIIFGVKRLSAASCSPVVYRPPSFCAKFTCTAPLPQAITNGATETMVPAGAFFFSGTTVTSQMKYF